MRKTQRFNYAKCPKCGRKVSLAASGCIHTHKLGKQTGFVCPGSGTLPSTNRKETDRA